MAKPSIKFKSLILCEEIRREDNGKLLFIGVYQDNILAYQFPSNLKLSFWISAETYQAENPIEIDISLKSVKTNSKKSIARTSLDVTVPDEKFKKNAAGINYWIEGFVLSVQEPSLLIISGRINGGRFREIDSRAIIRHPDHASET